MSVSKCLEKLKAFRLLGGVTIYIRQSVVSSIFA